MKDRDIQFHLLFEIVFYFFKNYSFIIDMLLLTRDLTKRLENSF
jgi:hypothetical protein